MHADPWETAYHAQLRAAYNFVPKSTVFPSDFRQIQYRERQEHKRIPVSAGSQFRLKRYSDSNALLNGAARPVFTL